MSAERSEFRTWFTVNEGDKKGSGVSRPVSTRWEVIYRTVKA